MGFSVIEVASWVLERKVVDEVSSVLIASNLLFICYAALSLKLKNSCFIAAFFILEVISYFVIPVELPEYVIYSYYVTMYAVCYWICASVKMEVRSLFACAVMILFQIIMVMDAVISPQDETFMYLYYEYFFVSIHLYFISTFIKWEFSWSNMVNRINRFLDMLRYNYNFSFLLL